MVKFLKIFPNVFDRLNEVFLDNERNAKNRSPLQSNVLEKTKNNYQKLAVFGIQCPKTLHLSYQNQH